MYWAGKGLRRPIGYCRRLGAHGCSFRIFHFRPFIFLHTKLSLGNQNFGMCYAMSFKK